MHRFSGPINPMSAGGSGNRERYNGHGRKDALGPTLRPAVPFATLDRDHEEIADELRAAFDRVVSRSAFVLGEEIEAFEADWARACMTSECVGVSSGTAALAILLRATGIVPGEEVIVPAHTYIATALAVLHVGAVPVLCDVEEDTGLLDVDAAAVAIIFRTAGIVAVHLYGQFCDMPAVRTLAERHGIAVFEDAAQAHGGECGGTRAGGFGSGAAFSFYPSKNLGALGDGGAICTNDRDIAERARQLRNLGQRSRDDHVSVGGNERLDGLQAALLRAKLPRLDAANLARRRHASTYRRALDGRARLLEERPVTPCVYHVFPVRAYERDGLSAQLASEGIATRVHYPLALHQQPALRGLTKVPGELSRTEAWAREELSLPMSPSLTTAEVERVAESCEKAIRAGALS